MFKKGFLVVEMLRKGYITGGILIIGFSFNDY